MFGARRQQREDQLLSVLSSMQQALVAMADAHKEQAKVFTTFLESFHVTSPPEVRVVRDEDELRMEIERAEAKRLQSGQWAVPAPEWIVMGED